MLLPDGGLETRQDDGRETRALTTTANYAGPVKQRPILDRLFAPGILEALGVRLDSVPSGRAEWPLITAGAAPDMKTEATAADAAPKVTFKTEILKPKRLTGALAYSHEMNAQVMGLEPALRRDLAAAVRSKMSDQILNGDEATNAQDVDGFYTKLSAPDVPAAVATYADYSGSHAGSVDGIHAETEGEISSVIGVASYQHAAGVFQTGSGESGTEALKRRSRSCRASAYVPAALGLGSTGQRPRRQHLPRGGRPGRSIAGRLYRRRVAEYRSDTRPVHGRVDRRNVDVGFSMGRGNVFPGRRVS